MNHRLATHGDTGRVTIERELGGPGFSGAPLILEVDMRRTLTILVLWGCAPSDDTATWPSDDKAFRAPRPSAADEAVQLCCLCTDIDMSQC